MADDRARRRRAKAGVKAVPHGPTQILGDTRLDRRQKQKALESLAQDARQLLTASNEGMAPQDESFLASEPQLDEAVEAQRQLRRESPRKDPQ